MTVIPEWTLADRLRKARQVVGLDQRGFASLLGVTGSTYSQWEAGLNKPRDIIGVAQLVETIADVPATWLLGLRDPRPVPDGGLDHAVRPKGLEPPTFCSGVWQIFALVSAFVRFSHTPRRLGVRVPSREVWVLGA